MGDLQRVSGRLRDLQVDAASAISGRTLGIVADHKGVGSGTADYDEGPRTYDFLVESVNVDWKFRVEETSGAFAKGHFAAGVVRPS